MSISQDRSKTLKLYDWNGVGIDIDEFWRLLEEKESELFHNYRVLGKTDVALKQEYKPAVMAKMREWEGSGELVYPAIPGFQDRIDADLNEGYRIGIFTSMDMDDLERQANGAGLSLKEFIILNLSEAIKEGNLPEKISKESPEVFAQTRLSFQSRDIRRIVTYVDDAEERIMAAASANAVNNNAPQFESLYHFSPKFNIAEEQKDGFYRINDISRVVEKPL
tara:strand:- start:2785 stop:3450 length:666 start_codon:yes stop_codon:yes gene_type:complete